MTAVWYLGVDGGGTHCRARLADENGRPVGEGVAGPANVTFGVEPALKAIRLAAGQAIQAAGLNPDEIGRIRAGFGLAGATVPALREAIRTASFPYACVSVASDSVAACLGAYHGKDGAILIVGTGSQGLAFLNGTITTLGGWGFALSDEGSGAALGKAALRAAVAAADGLAERSPLTDVLMQTFKHDRTQTIVWSLQAKARDYAAFAPLVFEHGGKGDPVAKRLLGEAMSHVIVLIDRLTALGASAVCLVGGLAASYRAILPTHVAARLIDPQGDALDGALILAKSGAPA